MPPYSSWQARSWPGLAVFADPHADNAAIACAGIGILLIALGSIATAVWALHARAARRTR